LTTINYTNVTSLPTAVICYFVYFSCFTKKTLPIGKISIVERRIAH
jgi:hypothetical protein